MMLQTPIELIRVANIDSPCRVGHYPRSQFSYLSCSKSWHMCSPTVTAASNFWNKLAFLRLKAVKDTHMLQFVLIGSNLLLLSFFFRASFTLPVSCFDLQQFQAHSRQWCKSSLESFNCFHSYVIPSLQQTPYFILLILVYFPGQTRTNTSVKSVKSGLGHLFYISLGLSYCVFIVFAHVIFIFPSLNIFLQL